MTITALKPGSDGLLSPVYHYLNQDGVSEVLINRSNELWVERGGRMMAYQVPGLSQVYLRRLFSFLANENKQVLSPESPFLSGSLTGGERVQLVIPAASTDYTLSIRRPHGVSVSIDDYDDNGFFTGVKSSVNASPKEDEFKLISLYKEERWSEFIKAAVRHKKNIIISGGTSSGKTTFLNACTSEIAPSERLITLEDTREVTLSQLNQVNLLAPKNGPIKMKDLVHATLRLRPDRIIMGEIRGEEIMDFISACSTGHDGSIATIHANSPRGAFLRMVQLYKQNNVPSMTDSEILREINSVIDVIVQLKKTQNGRRATQIWFKDAEEARQ